MLEAVRKAEADREAPRKGVIKAIDEIAAKALHPFWRLCVRRLSANLTSNEQ